MRAIGGAWAGRCGYSGMGDSASHSQSPAEPAASGAGEWKCRLGAIASPERTRSESCRRDDSCRSFTNASGWPFVSSRAETPDREACGRS